MSIIRSYPERISGISISTPASAWGYGSYVRIVDYVNKDIKLFGFRFQVTNTPTADATNEFLFEISIGRQGNEVVRCQQSYIHRSDTNAGYFLLSNINIFFPEPVIIKEGQRLSIRAADSLSSAITYQGIKILYSSSVALSANHDINNFEFVSAASGISVTEKWR